MIANRQHLEAQHYGHARDCAARYYSVDLGFEAWAKLSRTFPQEARNQQVGVAGIGPSACSISLGWLRLSGRWCCAAWRADLTMVVSFLPRLPEEPDRPVVYQTPPAVEAELAKLRKIAAQVKSMAPAPEIEELTKLLHEAAAKLAAGTKDLKAANEEIAHLHKLLGAWREAGKGGAVTGADLAWYQQMLQGIAMELLRGDCQLGYMMAQAAANLPPTFRPSQTSAEQIGSQIQRLTDKETGRLQGCLNPPTCWAKDVTRDELLLKAQRLAVEAAAEKSAACLDLAWVRGTLKMLCQVLDGKVGAVPVDGQWDFAVNLAATLGELPDGLFPSHDAPSNQVAQERAAYFKARGFILEPMGPR